MEIKGLDETVKGWLQISRKQILAAMQQPLTVATKSNRNDLVTNVDKANQAFLIQQIHAAFPDASIEGEEGQAAKADRMAGPVFFVDPIDGTMNFVKQQANFAVMIGVYQDGQPLYGAIMDVMRNEVISGGPDLAPNLNGEPLTPPLDRPFEASLVGISGPMAIKNRLHLGELGLASSGVRMSGSAGMEFKSIALGRLGGYVSWLQPWDVAAGLAIGQGFGLVVTRGDGQPLDLLEAGVVVAGMPQVHAAFIAGMNA